jgi:hypothetical protein
MSASPMLEKVERTIQGSKEEGTVGGSQIPAFAILC